jgi:SAM-dependent methyltransferase
MMTRARVQPSCCNGYKYVGEELPLFTNAQNWKRYFRSQLTPFIGGDVAEIGAGNGSTTAVLSKLPHTHWYAVEPDSTLVAELTKRRQLGELAPTVEPLLGGLEVLTPISQVDTILYIDVLEHIVDDRAELKGATAHLRPGGHLIVLSPAYQILFTPFDAAIGHYRRYTARALGEVTPPDLTIRKSFYLDSVGLLASLANKMFLRQSKPTSGQILFWDRVLIPLSRIFDPMVCRSVGRSVIIVWQKR